MSINDDRPGREDGISGHSAPRNRPPAQRSRPRRNPPPSSPAPEVPRGTGSDNGHPGSEYRLRGIVAYNAEDFRLEQDEQDSVEHWRRTFRAKDKAKELNKREKLQAGGDRSLFGRRRTRSIGKPAPVAFSPSGLLLSTGIHRISAPPGSGKTRIGYWDALMEIRAALEAYQAGHIEESQLIRWAVGDTEMYPERYRQALEQLGASDDELDCFDYIEWPGYIPNLIEHGRALTAEVRSWGCSGIIYDAQVSFLGPSGVTENDPVGIRDWTVSACAGMRKAIILDHTGHSDETRGRGSSDKAAGCDVDLWLRVDTPFALGISGAVTLGVNKDRSGTLAAGAEIAVEVECGADNDSMEFVPIGEWGDVSSRATATVADILGLLLIRPEFSDRNYATAGELQGELTGTFTARFKQVQDAVSGGSIKEEKVGKSKHYTLP